MPQVLRWTLGTAGLLAAGFLAWTVSSPRSEAPGAAGGLSSGPLVTPVHAEAAEIVITPGARARQPVRVAESETEPQKSASEKKVASQATDPKPSSGNAAAAKATAGAGKGDQGDSEDLWQVILLDEKRIGWSRTTQQTIQSEGRTILRTTNDVTMKFLRFGQQIDMQKVLTTEESPEGELLGYSMELRNPPAATTRTTGSIQGKELKVETTIGGRRQQTRLDWDADVRGPAWQERLLKTPPLKPAEKRSFKSFFPDFNKVATVKIQADRAVATKMLDGKERMLLKVRMSNDLVPDMVTRAYLDDTGKTLRTDDDLLGKVMTLFTVSQEEALRELSGSELDVATNTLVPAGAIRQPHKAPKVVYRITLNDDDPAKYLSEGDTQSIKRIAANVVELTVTAMKPPRDPKAVPIDDEYVRPTQFLQSNDARVIEHAKKGALGVETNLVHSAVQMERYVNRNVKKKNFSTALASAAEVAKTLEGDCTEHAVLLAAMLRSRGIPSRVAVGLVYVEGAEAFGGHMWTEAWLGGHWYPLDATLGQGGIGAGHIRLAESSFADDAPSPVTTFLPLIKVLGRVKIEVVPQ